MNGEPAGRAGADRATSDTAAPVPTATTPDRPDTVPAQEIVPAREIAEFLHDLARFRSPALGGGRGEHAALLARKTELLHRIAEQRRRSTADPSPTPPTAPGTGTP